MKTICYLAAIAGLLLLAGCTGMSALEAGGAVTATVVTGITWGEKLAEFVGIISPYLSPEMQVVVAQTVSQAVSLGEAAANGLTALAHAVGGLAGDVAANATAVEDAAERAAEGVTLTEALTIGGASVIGDRAVSAGQRAHRAAKAAKNGSS